MAKEKGNSKVTIYPDWCKGCGICVAFCPAKVIELDGQERRGLCVNRTVSIAVSVSCIARILPSW